MVGHPFGKSGGHRHCGCGDINIPTNKVILPQIQDPIFVGYL